MVIIANIQRIIKDMRYYEISPTSIVRADSRVLTYGSEKPLEIGSVVQIPVGKKTMIGIVISQVDQPSYAIKNVFDTVESLILPQELINLAYWISDYYSTHLATVWQTVLPRGLTKKRRPLKKAPHSHRRDRTTNLLTDDQSSALETISNMTNGSALLHGVTGSGKTMVYIEAAKKALEDNKSVIILVPEIALTSQLVAEFANHFDDILLTHSRQTEAERHLTWQAAIQNNKPQIVIGPRSALFMPLKNIGLIVIDEAHEPSFKQEQSPRYSALRTASVLAAEHQTKLVLGSATPNVVDYFLASSSKRPIIKMPKPARQDTVAPDVELVDMTKRNNFTKHPFLSNQLIDSLDETFAAGKQALIFHNRRGSASTTLCSNCGWQAGCPRCYVPLTLHADSHQLRCHICNLSSAVPTSCPACQNADIIHKGLGTKRIESELNKIFTHANIARFDSDTASDDTVDKRYQELYEGKINLIIGTQVIAKGLDLPDLRTVGVIQADSGLSLPDFTAPERTFQLLAQVMGRVGRSHHPTKVVVQTYQPEHPAVKDGVTQNYADFYERTLAQRKHTNFPPYCYLLKLTCVYKTEKSAIESSRKLAAKLKNLAKPDTEILGPTPAFYERVRDTYRWQLLIKSPKRQDLVDLLGALPPTHWQYELDPVSLL